MRVVLKALAVSYFYDEPIFEFTFWFYTIVSVWRVKAYAMQWHVSPLFISFIFLTLLQKYFPFIFIEFTYVNASVASYCRWHSWCGILELTRVFAISARMFSRRFPRPHACRFACLRVADFPPWSVSSANKKRFTAVWNCHLLVCWLCGDDSVACNVDADSFAWPLIHEQ